MLVCGALGTALSASFGAFVQIAIFLLQNSNISRVQASLPPGTEDEIILIEHLPGRRVHLQDFFWTDAEDAPPWVDPNQGLTFYETRTVHHTVTVYSPVENEDTSDPILPRPGPHDPGCTTCIEPTPRLDDDEDQNIGVLIGDDPGPRYWLLTVLRAGEAVPPKVELRLARLYRAAFSRQQQRHLGLLSTNPRSRRTAKEMDNVEKDAEIRTSETSTTLSTESTVRIESRPRVITMSKPMKMIEISKFRKTLLPTSEVDDTGSPGESTETEDYFHPRGRKIVEGALLPTTSKYVTSDSESRDIGERRKYNSGQRYFPDEASLNSSSAMQVLQIATKNGVSPRPEIQGNPGDVSASASASQLRSLDRTTQEIVQVRMQNTTVVEGGATRLIYSVHLGGKPVPAETAARDMALLSPQEVALELGAPVIVQSEQTRPLALSRKRDVWLLVGATGAGFFLLALVLVGLTIAAKRKKAHSAAVAPPNRSILKKEREYVPDSPDRDNAAFSASETEVKTDGTSQRQTPGSLSRSPITPETPDSLEPGIHEVSSDNEEDSTRKARPSSPWDIQDHPSKKTRLTYGRMSRANAIDSPRTPDSTDMMVNHLETLESLENGYARPEEATASPHSYLSMPSCKQFPSMRTVEPLSRVLEPVMVKHLDIDSPETGRRDNGQFRYYRDDRADGRFFARTSSATKDPGVVGPIVWSLRKQGLSAEGNGTSDTDLDPAYLASSGPVGRARKRLHELLEDSFSLFGSRDAKHNEQRNISARPSSAARTTDALRIISETRGRSAHVSPVASPTTEMKSRPRTSLPRRGFDEDITETGHTGPAQPRGAWGSRPLSAGPFHRPNLPEVDTRRILTEYQLQPEDPAIPLIASIKKELERFPQ